MESSLAVNPLPPGESDTVVPVERTIRVAATKVSYMNSTKIRIKTHRAGFMSVSIRSSIQQRKLSSARIIICTNLNYSSIQIVQDCNVVEKSGFNFACSPILTTTAEQGFEE